MRNKRLLPTSRWKMFPLNKRYLSSDISSFPDRYMGRRSMETIRRLEKHVVGLRTGVRCWREFMPVARNGVTATRSLELWISVLHSEPFGQGGWDPRVLCNNHVLFILSHCHIGLRSLCVPGSTRGLETTLPAVSPTTACPHRQTQYFSQGCKRQGEGHRAK